MTANAPTRQISNLCEIMHHELCSLQCSCDCHFSIQVTKTFEQFQWELWNSPEARKLAHAPHRRFTELWDVVAMWTSYNEPRMEMKVLDIYVETAWETLLKPDWQLSEVRARLKRNLSTLS